MFMVLLILNNPDLDMVVLDGWVKAGVPGVTILPSTGLSRIRSKMGLNEDLPLLPSLRDFFQQEENQNRTLIAIVRERSVVDGIIQATQVIVGDLNQPDTGILVILPVMEAYGLDRYSE